MKFELLITLAALILFNSNYSWGRWATLDDADSEMEFQNTSVTVNADGSSEQVLETQWKITKDQARMQVGTQTLYFNSGYESIQILEAKTIYQGKEYSVPKKNIETKPVASNSLGFDQIDQILLAYPHVELGSEIYLKYRYKTSQTPIPGAFSNSFVYGLSGYENKGLVKINSKLPLFISSRDPDHKLKITQSRSGANYLVNIEQIAPAYYRAVDEPIPFVRLTRAASVIVSNHQEWTEMVKPILKVYEKVLSKPLPDSFEKIAQEASKAGSTIEKINSVTSQMEDLLTYKGDWKTIGGKFIPHELAATADSRLGDCKDFSAVAAAILRKLGYDAHIALVQRGVLIDEDKNDLPNLSAFNHAIVYLKDGERVYWVDPTNRTSYSQGIYPDIAGRRALVIGAEKAILTQTESLKPDEGRVAVSRETEVEDADNSHVVGNLVLGGNMAVSMTGASLNASKKTIDYSLMRTFGDEKNMSDWKVDDYDLSSRVVQDLMFHVEFSDKNSSIKTSAGPAYFLSNPASHLLSKVEDRVSDLVLGQPHVYEQENLLKNVNLSGSTPLNCEIDNSWVKLSREITEQDDGVKVVDKFATKKMFITNEEIHSGAFSEMKDKIEKCMDRVALVYQVRHSSFRGPAFESFGEPFGESLESYERVKSGIAY